MISVHCDLVPLQEAFYMLASSVRPTRSTVGSCHLLDPDTYPPS